MYVAMFTAIHVILAVPADTIKIILTELPNRPHEGQNTKYGEN